MHNKILKIALYAICFNILFTPFNSTLAALFGYLAIICSVMHPVIRSIRLGKLKINVYVVYFIAILVLSMAMSIENFSIENLNQYILLFLSFISFYWSLSFGRDKSEGLYLQDLYKVNYVLCFIYIVFSFGPFSFKYMEVGEWGAKVFNMGLGNPNSVAVYVMFSVEVLFIQLLSIQKKTHKAFNISLITILIYILVKLSSRTVLICVLAVVVYYIVRPRKKIGKVFLYFIMIFPAIMIPMQVLIGQKYYEIRILGKSLATGRADIYKEILDNIVASPHNYMFGRFFEYPFENMHNTPLTILVSIGVVGLLLYFMFWVRQINFLDSVSNTATQKIAFFSLLVFFLHSSSETMTMIGTIPYGVFVLLMVKIGKGDFRNKKQVVKKNEWR